MHPRTPRWDHVGLNVADLEKMTAWYVEAFGYRVQLQFDLTGIDLRIVMLVDDTGRRFELLQRGEGRPGLRADSPVEAAATWGLGHVCFEVDDLDAGFLRLLDMGAAEVMAPAPAPQEGWRMAWVQDPESNLVELISGPAAARPTP